MLCLCSNLEKVSLSSAYFLPYSVTYLHVPQRIISSTVYDNSHRRHTLTTNSNSILNSYNSLICHLQKPVLLGVKAEQEIAAIIEGSTTLEKLGVQFESLNARIRVQEKLQSNYDKREY